MPMAGFETAISASERPQTHVLDGVAIGIGKINILSWVDWVRTYYFMHRPLTDLHLTAACNLYNFPCAGFTPSLVTDCRNIIGI